MRVHVTVNTLLKENELPEALEFVKYLCSLPVDAVLVQDMGLFDALRQRAPELPLHASTQMSLHTPAGVKLLWELGASRAVLAREMSLEEIREVHESCPIEGKLRPWGALYVCVGAVCFQRPFGRPQRQPGPVCPALPSALFSAGWNRP